MKPLSLVDLTSLSYPGGSTHGLSKTLTVAEIRAAVQAQTPPLARPRELPRSMARRFEARQRHSVIQVAGALAVFYLALAGLHFLLADPEFAPRLAGVALVSSLAMGLLRWAAVRSADSPGRPNVIAVAMIALVGLNSGLHLYLDGELAHTTNFAFLLVGVGAIFFDWMWLLGAQAAILGVWSVAIRSVENRELLAHYSVALGFALFLSFLIHRIRRRDVTQLEIANRELARRASRDALTGLANRSELETRLEALCRAGARQRASIAVVMCDVDGFKSFNDHRGHLSGDAAIQRIARVLRDTARRPLDLAVRYGGDEFVLVLPEAGVEDAARLGERLREQVHALDLRWSESAGSRLTLSIGVAASVPERGDCASFRHALLQAADEALYRAKARGGDQVDWSYFFERPVGIGREALGAEESSTGV